MAASRRISFVCAAGALIAAALLFGGGSGDGAVAWIGGAALVVALVACGLAFWGLLPLPGLGREGIAFALLGGGFAVWTGLTVVWSVLPDRSWDYFNRGLAYFAFAVVGAFAGSVLSTRVGAWLLGGARRCHVPVGPGREGRARVVRGLRAAGSASVSGRVLERARAGDGLRAADRAVGGFEPAALAASFARARSSGCMRS